MEEVPIEKAQRYAKTVFENLIPFALMNSTTPEKQVALEEISTLRVKLDAQFDIICPNWEAVD